MTVDIIGAEATLICKTPWETSQQYPAGNLVSITKHVYTALHRNKNKALFCGVHGDSVEMPHEQNGYLISLRSKEGESNEKERLEGAGAMRTWEKRQRLDTAGKKQEEQRHKGE